MRWCKQLIGLGLFCLSAMLIAGPASAGSELAVSAALSLKPPFEEIGRIYERKHPGSRVVFNFAASGVLQKQIEAGAPADVFASASQKEMDALENSGLLLPGSRRDFAGNTIVLIAASNGHVRLSSFADLKKKGVGRIAIGDPSTVPAGKYSWEALGGLGLLESVRDKLVYAGHVLQVMDYVARDEVEAGMVFFTDALTRGREIRIIAEAPVSGHRPIIYPIAVIKGTKIRVPALLFISAVTSDDGRKILRKYGFRSVSDR